MIPAYEGLIGNTPLVELKNSSPNPKVRIFAKLELFNPTRSIKDRIALHIIKEAEQQGYLKPGMTIIEATSGNTGAALALVGSARGYKVRVTTPSKTNTEKIQLMEAYGAEVMVCPGKSHDQPDHYVSVASRWHKEDKNSFIINQYNNPANINAHFISTGPEIWQQMQGKIDYLVACASSGGTVTGVGRFLKSQNRKIQVIVPDPIGSVYYPYFKTKKLPNTPSLPYKTQGAGKDYLCDCMDFSVIDDMVQFSDQDMFSSVAKVLKKEGLLVGETAAAAYHTGLHLAETIEGPANIVMIFPDAGEKYLSVYNTHLG